MCFHDCALADHEIEVLRIDVLDFAFFALGDEVCELGDVLHELCSFTMNTLDERWQVTNEPH